MYNIALSYLRLKDYWSSYLYFYKYNKVFNIISLISTRIYFKNYITISSRLKIRRELEIGWKIQTWYWQFGIQSRENIYHFSIWILHPKDSWLEKKNDLSGTILESKDSARYIKKTLIKILSLKIIS